jgi:RNA polymerase sigma-70 factor, ECF subfamily
VTDRGRPGHELTMPRLAAGAGPMPLSVARAPELDAALFYDAHFDFVWRSLRRLGVLESSLDDATHDVFIVALRRQHEFRGESSIRTWLFGIAWNRARELSRQRRRRPEEPLPECLVVPTAATQEQAVLAREAFDLLYAALNELSEHRRDVFVMVELEEMTVPEVAAITSAPVNTVYSRLRLARADFKAALERQRARNPR